MLERIERIILACLIILGLAMTAGAFMVGKGTTVRLCEKGCNTTSSDTNWWVFML